MLNNKCNNTGWNSFWCVLLHQSIGSLSGLLLLPGDDRLVLDKAIKELKRVQDSLVHIEVLVAGQPAHKRHPRLLY